MQEATVEINGKLCRISNGATVSQLKNVAGVDRDEELVRVSHASAQGCGESDRVIHGTKYRSIPRTTEG
ncbi:MAG: hypothetical protein HGB35_00320 [Geobacteraceae bacterium]|nr:hypothetical protein [Geobacteraceae bacterium]